MWEESAWILSKGSFFLANLGMQSLDLFCCTGFERLVIWCIHDGEEEENCRTKKSLFRILNISFKKQRISKNTLVSLIFLDHIYVDVL